MSVLVLHTAAALFMTGVVWFVQLVHYPLLARGGGGGFARYEEEHTRRTGPVVAPPMLFELDTGVWLALAPPAALDPNWLWVNLAGLALIWGSALGLQVPAHRRLARGNDPAVVERLVATNWIRTLAWSVRVCLLPLVLLQSLLQAGAGSATLPVASPTPATL